MDDYLKLAVLGEGSYGEVYKCRHRQSGDIVAIKKYLHTSEQVVSWTLEREIKLLVQCSHENLVRMQDVFKHSGHLHAVFEFIDRSLLEEMQSEPQGLQKTHLRKHTFQILRAVHYLHTNNIVHRDIKPDNILVTGSGVVKLCDFGFARTLPEARVPLSSHVVTLWYKAPELLVGDRMYSKAVDVWAIGCTILIMARRGVFLAGDSEIDQLHQIVKRVGPLTPGQMQIFTDNPNYSSFSLPEVELPKDLRRKYGLHDPLLADLVESSLQIDPANRPSCSGMMNHEYFTGDGFPEIFIPELQEMVQKDVEARRMSLHETPDGSGEEKPSSSSPSATPASEKEDAVVDAVSDTASSRQRRDRQVSETVEDPDSSHQSELEACGYQIINVIFDHMTKRSPSGWVVSSSSSFSGPENGDLNATGLSDQEQLSVDTPVPAQDGVRKQDPQVKRPSRHFSSAMVPSCVQPVLDLIHNAMSAFFSTDESKECVTNQADVETNSPSALAIQMVDSTFLELAKMAQGGGPDAPGTTVEKCIALANVLSLSAVLSLEPGDSNIQAVLSVRKDMAAAVTQQLHGFLCQEQRDRGGAVPPAPSGGEGAAVTSSPVVEEDPAVMSSARHGALDSTDRPVEKPADPLADSGENS
ncbi:cyclin-dependent kinase-like 1 [Centroberyx affinis]|uniref:cyclin-dependent kinase-like 1 n=1 Tax=Centroberyx affinis TaxID=166261 RepID=UPI003A5BF772